MKKCMHCGYNTESVLATLVDAAEVRVLCPNCFTMAIAAGDLTFEPDYNLVDDITGLPGAVKFLNEFESYTLAPRTMMRLLAHDLRPREWKALAEKYSAQWFMLHDDFYDEDGVAWQPVVHIPSYVWMDVVEINNMHYVEFFEISGKMDGDAFQIDDFLMQVALKHGVDVDDIKTYVMDNIEFNPDSLAIGAEDCGCYIDGEPEWFRTEEA